MYVHFQVFFTLLPCDLSVAPAALVLRPWCYVTPPNQTTQLDDLVYLPTLLSVFSTLLRVLQRRAVGPRGMAASPTYIRNEFETRGNIANQAGQQNIYGDQIFQSVYPHIIRSFANSKSVSIRDEDLLEKLPRAS